MKPHLSALFQLAPHILSGMRHAGLLVFLVIAICSTSACAGNGNAYGYDNGKAYGHDQSDSDKGASNYGWSGGSGATGSGSMPTILSPEGAASASDQNIARDAVEAGEALPLSEIAKRVRSLFSARVLDARLVERGKLLVYRLTILTDSGVSKQVDLDAKAGTVLRVR